MKALTLHKHWIVEAPLERVFSIMTDFEKFPTYFPRVAQSVHVISRKGNNLHMEAHAKSFGKTFVVKMNTEILPGKGFISDN